MEYIDFYTGQPVQKPSSPELEAADFASFGKYGYDPRYTAQMNNSNFQPVASYGYNPYQQYPQQQMYPPNNTGVGLGANPYYYNQQQYYYPQYPQQQLYMPSIIQPQPVNPNYFAQQQQMNRLSTTPGGFGFSPQYQNQNPYYAERVFMPGQKMTGEYLFNIDDEKEIRRLERECNRELIEAEAIQIAQASMNFKGNGYDVVYRAGYGAQENARIIDKFTKKIDAIVNAARNRRREFELGLRKFAHKFIKDNVTEKQIEESYDGHYVKNPIAPEYEEGYNPKMFKSREEYISLLQANKNLELTVPCKDSAIIYQGIFDRASQEAQQFIDPNCKDLKDFLEQATNLNIFYIMQKEDLRRQNLVGYYNQNRPTTYRDSMRLFIAEKQIKKMIEKANPDIPMQMEAVRRQNQMNDPGRNISYLSDTDFYLRGMNNVPFNRPMPKGYSQDGIPLYANDGVNIPRESTSPFEDDGTALNAPIPDTPLNVNPEDIEMHIGEWTIMSPAARKKRRAMEEEAQRQAWEASRTKQSQDLVDKFANSTMVDERGVRCIDASQIPGVGDYPILAQSGSTLAEDGVLSIKCHPDEAPRLYMDQTEDDVDKFEKGKEAFKDTIRKSLKLRPLHSGLLKNEVAGASDP